MPKVDIPIKRLMQRRPKDWITYLLPQHENTPFDVVNPDMISKAESRMDSLWRLRDGEGTYLHFEPQGYLDVTFPARMLRYRTDIWEYTLSKGEGVPAIHQVALFISPENENKIHCFEDFTHNKDGISYSYQILRAWELDKGVVIQKRLASLYPLLPLMKEKPGETPKQIIRTTVRIIDDVEDESLQADLLAATSILAENRYAAALIRKIIRREMLMESELLKEWTAEERKEAAREATIQYSRQTLLLLLKTKYVDIPKHVEVRVMDIEDQDALNHLLVQLINLTNLDEFLESLERVAS